MLNIKKLGKWFGYPECCTEYFIKSFGALGNKEGAEISEGTGYIPCPDCTKLIKEGKTTLKGLIKDREEPIDFPYANHPSSEKEAEFVWLSFSYKGKNQGVCNLAAKSEADALKKAKKLKLVPKYDDIFCTAIPKLELPADKLFLPDDPILVEYHRVTN